MPVLIKIPNISDTLYPILNCIVDVEIGDYVYINQSGFLDKALASDKTKMPAIYRVLDKPSSTQAQVAKTGILDRTNLSINTPYFISETQPGKVQTLRPGNNSILQIVERSINTSKSVFYVDSENLTER